jgi:hypothetical protein
VLGNVLGLAITVLVGAGFFYGIPALMASNASSLIMDPSVLGILGVLGATGAAIGALTWPGDDVDPHEYDYDTGFSGRKNPGNYDNNY